MNWSQVIIRCYTKANLSKIGFEDQSSYVKDLWLSEPPVHLISHKDMVKWVFECMNLLEEQRNQNTEFVYEVVLFLEPESKIGAHQILKFDGDFLRLLGMMKGNLEILIGTENGDH